jgi:glyoxylase-like metal-dependent hydrolase (beta-lactamase superfamily II)
LSFTVSEVLPGLVRFSIPFPGDPRRHVNSFLFLAGPDALLLDASWDVPEALEALDSVLATAGLARAAVRTVLITHAHPDHAGLAGKLAAQGARIGFHPGETITLLRRFRRLEEMRGDSRFWERLNGFPEDGGSSLAVIHSVEHTLKDIPDPTLPLLGGETIEIGEFRLRPVWTPGHTLGHLCYWEERQRLLFTGDHVLPTITPHVGLYVHVISNPLPNYLDSLRLLKDYRPALVLPAHGDPFTDLHGRLDQLIEHHHERAEEMYALVGDEPVSAWSVASRARWTRRHVTLDQVSPRHHRLALAETLAHLELLRAEGRLSKVFVPGEMRYRRAPAF